jgi:hypothetical protein
MPAFSQLLPMSLPAACVRSALVFALALASAAAIVHTPAHAAPDPACKPITGGHGVGDGEAIARIKAKAHWSKLVTAAYGEDWAAFPNARGAAFNCQGKVTLWGCSVIATPCKAPDLAQPESAATVRTAQQATQ